MPYRAKKHLCWAITWARHVAPASEASLLIGLVFCATSIGAPAAYAGRPAAEPNVAVCLFSVPVRIAARRGSGEPSKTLTSGVGLSACTGSLGPWGMAGETGWARAGGSVTLSGSSPGGLSAGRIRLFAKVPRFAWFHASMVSLTSVLRVRPGAGVLLLSGRGRLVPTARSPVAASLAITGTGKLELARTKSARNGRLTFALRITNTDPM